MREFISSFRLFSNSGRAAQFFRLRFCSCLARAVQVMVAGRRGPCPAAQEAKPRMEREQPSALRNFWTNCRNESWNRSPFFTAALSSAAACRCSAQTYPSGFSVALDRGGDLSQALPEKFGKELASQAHRLATAGPAADHAHCQQGRKQSARARFPSRRDSLTLSTIFPTPRPLTAFNPASSINTRRTSPARRQTILRPVAANVDARYWKDDVLNDQASYFNQMIGMMVAINLSHHYLGHFDKYAAKMAAAWQQNAPHQ